MTVPELRAVMDSIPGLCAKTCQDDLEAVNNWQFGAYWAIWRGMNSCKILPIEKFDKAIIRKMAESLLSLKDPPGISDAGKLGKISASSHTDPALFRLEVYRQLWPASSYVEPHDFVSHFVSWIQSLDEVDTEGPDRTPGQLSPDADKESISNNQLSALDTELVNIIAYAYANQDLTPHAPPVPQRLLLPTSTCATVGCRSPPLFSKAVVRAAITAPLENYEWVSTVKLRWVLRLVLSIEGPEVAERLDKLVWRWRGEVIREARRRWDEAGLFRTMGPSTVVTVRRAGLFDHDFPKWRRPFKKVVMPAGFFAPRFLRRTRFAVGEKEMRKRSWGRLSRREGGMGGCNKSGAETEV
ncbi:hypothetical protein GTA08_BOTSDO06982 [Botryosphaeria dothidea]|uniref:Uncharacterized protein n=1 Tax=Botryosphaeria dothidea TaxID=55169 RepID=A0A8H4MZH8_9PEZI|nr:hypothetical protein GTA08_BOTSDO06982 [Botryosphaeria dothidea]